MSGLPVVEDSLRAQIISAALELFREHGYHSTSLQDIIVAAGCSKGGFYHHFSSKEDLLFLIHDIFITHELERGEAVIRRTDTAANRLRQVMIDLVESIDVYRPHVIVFFEERRFLSSDKFIQIKEKRDRYEAVVRTLVAEGIANGEFNADVDPGIATMAIFGMCNWTYQWLRPGGRLQAPEVGEMFFQYLFQGILAKR